MERKQCLENGNASINVGYCYFVILSFVLQTVLYSKQDSIITTKIRGWIDPIHVWDLLNDVKCHSYKEIISSNLPIALEKKKFGFPGIWTNN